MQAVHDTTGSLPNFVVNDDRLGRDMPEEYKQTAGNMIALQACKHACDLQLTNVRSCRNS